jgi:hypothetical protein
VLLGNVAEVKAAAEDAILIGNRCIGEELARLAGLPQPSPCPVQRAAGVGRRGCGGLAASLQSFSINAL